MNVASVIVVVAGCTTTAVAPVTLAAPVSSAVSESARPRERADIDATIVAFRCVGWSPARHVALCFTGETSAGSAPEVTATFVALGDDAHAPADVTFALESSDLAHATIPPATLAALRVATPDFVRFDDVTEITGEARIGSFVLLTRSKETDPGGENMAPRVHWEIVKREGNAESLVDATDGAISTFAATAYRAGDHTVVLRAYSIADEGQYEQHGDVFVVR